MPSVEGQKCLVIHTVGANKKRQRKWRRIANGIACSCIRWCMFCTGSIRRRISNFKQTNKQQMASRKFGLKVLLSMSCILGLKRNHLLSCSCTSSVKKLEKCRDHPWLKTPYVGGESFSFPYVQNLEECHLDVLPPLDFQFLICVFFCYLFRIMCFSLTPTFSDLKNASFPPHICKMSFWMRFSYLRKPHVFPGFISPLSLNVKMRRKCDLKGNSN